MARTSGKRRVTPRKPARVVTGGQLAAAAAAFLALALLCVALFALLLHASTPRVVNVLDDAGSLAVDDVQIASGRAVNAGRTMPVYLQDDPQWGYLPYADGSTVAESGCGLTCAAMACVYLANQIVTPLDLNSSVGDSCTVAGVNDMALFGRYMAAHYGLTTSEMFFDLDRALEEVESGAVVYASLQGQFGDRAYGGHIVAIWRVDGENIYVRDPASGANSQRAFTVDELRRVEWAYFYAIERSDGQ